MNRIHPLAIDALLVVAFAAVGRLSHAEGLSAGGILETAWPFLAGVMAGWLLATPVGQSPRSLGFGAVVVGMAVAVGMMLRGATGQGTAPAFIIVAALVIGVLLLGWRLLARFADARET